MQITMLETRRGTEDGHVVKRFEKGQTYDVAHTLAVTFLNNGWAFNAEPEDEEPAEPVLSSAERLYQAFRPQPTRGSAPTNPATLAVIGKDE